MNRSTRVGHSSGTSTGPHRWRSILSRLGIAVAISTIGCEQQATTETVAASDNAVLSTSDDASSNVTAVGDDSEPTKTTTAQAGNSKTESEDHSDHPAGMGRGRGMGMGRGPRGMAGMRGDMTTLHTMFASRDKIKRTVKNLPNGAQATTESDDKTIAGLIQEHVPAMEGRVMENNPLPPMTFHPVFIELIKHSQDYELSYEETDKGMKVVYKADDPFVIMLVQEHAKLVSRFLKNGMEEIHKPYTLPEVNEAKGEASPATEATDVEVSDAWRALPTIADSPADNPSTVERVELGKKLFFDPRLSLTGTVSCNTCHNIMEGGDDGRPTSMGIRGLIGPRNAPTVWNSAFQASHFWDGRSPSLEDQAGGPIVAGPEMGMPAHQHAVDRIASVPGYQAEFREVFGEGDVIQIENTVKAIAAFERTLITPNSPFDRYVQGEQTALTEQQIRGMNFFDSVGCTECHSGAAFNNWNPGDDAEFLEFPRYTTSPYITKYELTADHGRSEVTKDEADKHHFKVPTLRNITLTAPYFHNGSVATLTDSVKVMAETQLDTTLSDSDVADIVSFLNSLEGTFPEITLPRIPSRSGESLINEHEVETASSSDTTNQ